MVAVHDRRVRGSDDVITSEFDMVQNEKARTREERSALIEWHARPAETLRAFPLPADPEQRRQAVRASPAVASALIFRTNNRELAALFVAEFEKDPNWHGSVQCMRRDILFAPGKLPRRQQVRGADDEPCLPHRMTTDPFFGPSGRRRGSLDAVMFEEDVGDR